MKLDKLPSRQGFRKEISNLIIGFSMIEGRHPSLGLVSSDNEHQDWRSSSCCVNTNNLNCTMIATIDNG